MFDKYLNKDILESPREELLKSLFADKESELREMELAIQLSEFSTTQLKAELRRRKKRKAVLSDGIKDTDYM